MENESKETAKVIGATILCDRKAHNQMDALPAMAEITGLSSLYVNVETDLGGDDFSRKYKDMLEFIAAVRRGGLSVEMCIWSWRSTWRGKPRYDQDQLRLAPICVARNMARQHALSMEASHLLFIDADVVPSADGLGKLLS